MFWKSKKQPQIFSKTFSVTNSYFITYGNDYYEKNPILRTVIDYVATAFSGLPLTGDLRGHSFLGSETSFLKHSCTLLLLDGDVFFATSPTKTIVPLPKKYISYNDKNNTYQINNFALREITKRYPIAATAKIVRWALSPFQVPYSKSKIDTIRPILDRLDANITTVSGILSNGHPSGILTLKDPMHTAVTPDVREELEKFFLKTYSKEGYAAIHVSSLPFEFIPLTIDWKTLELNQIYLNDVRLVCAAFGVSPILILDTERSTYNNISEARIRFYNDTLIPLMWSLIETLNQGFLLNITLNVNEINAIAEDKMKNVETVLKLLEKQVISRDEARKLLGF